MTLYRVATANMYDRTIQNISQRQSDLVKTQEQLSSGKRVTRASDDAVAATLAERAQNRLARVEADLKALDASRTALTQAESALGEANDLLHRARELMVQAGNPTLTANIREDLAKQIEGLREQMLAVANRQDTSGLTLFGGLGGSSKPFVDVYGPGAGVQFNGQTGQYAATETSLPQAVDGSAVWMRVPTGNGTFSVSLDPANQGQVYTTVGRVTAGATPTGDDYQIDFVDNGNGGFDFTVTNLTTATQVVPATTYQAGMTISFEGLELELQGPPANGDQINITASAPGDLFATMQSAIDALRYTGTNQPAHIAQEIGRVLTEMDVGLDRVLDVRGRLGDWLNRADSMQAVFEDKSVFHQKEKSDQEDLDMVKGISQFETQQVALQAALQSYAQVQRLSLFQYIA